MKWWHAAGALVVALVLAIAITDTNTDTLTPAPPPALAMAPPVLDAKAFAPLHRSLTFLHTAVEASAAKTKPLSHAEYTALVDTATAEIRLAVNRSETDADREILVLFNEVVQAYMDADFVWKLRTATTDAWHHDISLFYSRHPPLDSKARMEMAKRYGLPIQDSISLSASLEDSVTIPPDSVQRIIKIASEKFTIAETRYQDMLQSHPVPAVAPR